MRKPKPRAKRASYYFWKTDIMMTKQEIVDYWKRLCDKYPIISIEDRLGRRGLGSVEADD